MRLDDPLSTLSAWLQKRPEVVRVTIEHELTPLLRSRPADQQPDSERDQIDLWLRNRKDCPPTAHVAAALRLREYVSFFVMDQYGSQAWQTAAAMPPDEASLWHTTVRSWLNLSHEGLSDERLHA